MTMKNILLLLFTMALLNARAISLPDGPQVGQMAPVLKLPVWLQTPPEAANGWPTGKVVVLEFWSTGCGPCVAEIPHLNEMVDEFKDKPVQFVAVTDDSEKVIKRFLKKTPIKGWIGLGPEAGMGEGAPYKLYAIPHTVLIDVHGRISAIADPFMITSNVIQECLDGGPGAFPTGKGSGTNRIVTWTSYNWVGGGGQPSGWVPGQSAAGIKPAYQVLIRPTPTNSVVASHGNYWPMSAYNEPVESWVTGEAMTAQNDTLKKAIQIVYDVKPTHVVADAELPKGKYDFYILLPQKQKQPQFEAIFSQAVAATFGLAVKRENRPTEVLVLKTNSASLETLAKSVNPDGMYSAFWNEAAATNQPLKSLADELEISSSMPVLDQTGLSRHFDFEIKWKQKDYAHPNIPGMIDAVKTLGLTLEKVKRPMDVVVVSKSD
jgi:uncharacterized protein (TIGR03435 family)